MPFLTTQHNFKRSEAQSQELIEIYPHKASIAKLIIFVDYLPLTHPKFLISQNTA